MADYNKTLFEIQGSKKGRSIFTKVSFQAGDHLFSEEPLISYEFPGKWEDKAGMNEKELEAHRLAIEGEYGNWDREKRKLFDKLSGPDNTLVSKFGNNCWRWKEPFVTDASATSTVYLYSYLAMINHSCRPNAFLSYNSSNEKGTLYAIQDIPKGEEILVDYNSLNFHLTASERETQTWETWRFKCTCAACIPPDVDQKEKESEMEKVLKLDRKELEALKNETISDARRVKLMRLWEATMEWETGKPKEQANSKNPKEANDRKKTKAMEKFDLIIKLLHQEGLVAVDQLGVALKGASAFYEEQMLDFEKAFLLCEQAREVAVKCLGAENPTVKYLDEELQRLQDMIPAKERVEDETEHEVGNETGDEVGLRRSARIKAKK